MIIQIAGLIFNLYLVFLIIKSNIKTISTSFNSFQKEIFTNSWLKHSSNDHNRLRILNRIVLLLLLSYIIFDLFFLFAISSVGEGIEISFKDGVYKINKLKLVLEIYLFLLIKIIINAQKTYYYNKSNATASEIYLILLTNVLGISSLIASNDWLKTIISWELFNISLYLLVSLNSYSESSLSATLKYFLLSALSTGFLLLGISIIYYVTGSTNYENIAISISQLANLSGSLDDWRISSIAFAFALKLLTFLFKLGAAPFYNWAPDLYDGLNSNITMWMIIIPKVTVLSLLLLLFIDNLLFISLPVTNNYFSIFSITDFFFLFSGCLSLIIGSIALNNQWKIKRFFAYSGISHVGFILLALYCYDLHSYLIYIIIYGITTINIFSILLILTRYKGRDIQEISQIIGLYRYNPFISIALALNLFSLAGK